MIFHIFGALGQFERDLIRERTRAGLDAAAVRGRKGGRLTEPARPISDLDDDAAELAALTAAVAEAVADPRKVRAWLLELTNGNLSAPPPLSE